MKSHIRNLLGAIAIMAVSGLIGFLHNAVRSHSMPLIPKLSARPSITKSAGEEAISENARSEGYSGTEAETAPSTPDQTLASGLVSVEQVKAALEESSVYIIDAREEETYRKGHIPGALNIPYDRFVEFYDFVLNKVPKEALIICYCWGPDCDFSDHLAEELHIMGYENVKIFRGGWEEWEEAGHPVEL